MITNLHKSSFGAFISLRRAVVVIIARQNVCWQEVDEKGWCSCGRVAAQAGIHCSSWARPVSPRRRRPLWTCLRELNVTFCAAVLLFLTCRFCACFALVYDVVHPSSQIRACTHKRWFSY